jgi:autotransporter-associated beta strand protein
MKKIVLIFFLHFGLIGFSQTTFDWMDTAPDGNWRTGASGARWFGGSCGSGCFDEPGFGILRFNNNHQLTMTNNVSGTYGIHQIIFGSVNTSNRTIGNTGANIVRFFDSSGADPKIENQSTGSHTISFNILGDADAADPLEINPVSGNLTFSNTIGNQGSPILIFGNNGFTARFNNIISGAGLFAIRQNSKVIFNDINTYSGNTELDNGELWIETTGNAIANNNIFLGNGGQLANTAKIFLSRTAGGTTFSRNININPGNANTRFLGGLNTSGINTFSGSIARSSSQPLNVEVVNAGGTVVFSGLINGSGNITKVGPGTMQLSTNNSTMTGTWLVENGTLVADNYPARLNGRPITLGTASTSGTFRFTGTSGTTTTTSATLAVNAGGGSVFNASATNFAFSSSFAPGGTLTAGAESTGTLRFTGTISGSNGVTIAGTGKVAYESAAKTYTGTTRLNSGTLEPTAANYIADTSNFIFNGGTYSTGNTTGFSETVGTLQLLENSTIRLGNGGNAHTLTFAASNSVSWTSARTLTITNWSGTPGVAGTAAQGRIFVGSLSTHLSSDQLNQITFQGYEPGAVLKSTGELMPKGYITYYSKGSLAPEVLANWSLTTDGTGASPANFTSPARFVIQNGHTMITGAAWTLSGANTTLQILNGGALVSTFAVTMPATGTFQIDNGGLYKHDNASAWATTIFNGTEVFGNSSTVEINETATTLPTNSTYGNLTFDLNTTTGQSVSFGGNLSTINGNFIVKNTQGFELRLGNTGTTLNIVGNLEVHPNAIFTLKASTNAGNQTVNVDGNVSLIGGTFYLNGPNSTSGGSAFLVARGASFTISENVTFTGGNLIGASGFYFNRNIEQTLTIAHPFSTGSVRNRFFVSTANSTPINEVYNGVAAQTTIDGTGVTPGAGWAAWPTAATALKSFTINNSTGVTLSTNRVVNTTLGLTSGTITPGANSLTLAETATFTGGSASSHVNGVLNRVYTTTGSAVFPVGKAGVYRPVGFEYTALTGTSTVSVNQIETALTGTLPADTNLNNARTWDISQTGGSSIGYRVTLDPTGDMVTGTVVMLKRESGTTTSNATTSPNFTNTSAFTTLTGTNNFTLGSTCTVTSNAGSNQTDCNAASYTLAANTPSFGTGTWTVTGPSANASQFSDSNSPTATFTPDGGSGVYTLTWTIVNGSCNANSNVTITTGALKTWNGSSWNPSAPTIYDAAVISGNYSEVANINACTLTVNSSAVVVIPSNNNITLEGILNVDSGSLTLSNNSNLLQNTSVTNLGNIIVKRNSSALKRLDYTLWSSPVTGQGLYAFSPLTSVLPNIRFYQYLTNTNFYNNSLGFGLTSLDVNNVNGTDTNNVQFETAKGYLIRMPWNHPTAATIWNGTFTGVPNNGNITYTMDNFGVGQRFNLVGNPYPSPISITQFVSDNSANITETLYFWRKSNNTTNNAYCSWSPGGPNGTFVSNNEDQVVNPNGIIRSGQGFFVEAKNNATTLNFNNGQRSSNTSNQFFRVNNSVDNDVETNRFWLNLTNTSGGFAQMAAGYMFDATDGVDRYDGKNINTGDVLLNSILDNADYTIQGKALPFNPTDVIPLSYKITTAGTYTIAIDHVDGLFTGGAQAIYLKDTLTATEHNLQSGAYTFASDAGSFTNRFEIIFQSQLGIGNPTFTENNVIIYTQNNDLVVNTGTIVMASIKVFDIQGRLLHEKKGINASQTIMGGGLANQVLLVQITSEDGVMVTKKVIR